MRIRIFQQLALGLALAAVLFHIHIARADCSALDNTSYASEAVCGQTLALKNEVCRVCSKVAVPMCSCPPGFSCAQDENFPNCEACTPGYYCPSSGATPKIPCPSGFYCPSGSWRPIKCPSFSVCTAKSARHFSLILILLIPIGIIYKLIDATYAAFKRHYKIDVNAYNFGDDLLKEEDETHLNEGQAGFNNHLANKKLKRYRRTICKGELNITFKNLCAEIYVAKGLLANMGLQTKSERKPLLQNISGTFLSGTITAIMGPSGCGKSSLLSVLRGKVKKSSGEILVNGEPGNIPKIKKKVGFVPQDDVMHADLTVIETLNHSADMRLPLTWSYAKRRTYVERIIILLKLEKIRDQLIGDDLKRGISGGQKKRVSIGVELVSAPSLLLLDEPTSGLDATATYELFRALRKIANEGITIAAVVHQPRNDVWKLFDQVILLGNQGKPVFIGSPLRAEAYFLSLNLKAPEKVNVCDFFLDKIAEDNQRDKAAAYASQSPGCEINRDLLATRPRLTDTWEKIGANLSTHSLVYVPRNPPTTAANQHHHQRHHQHHQRAVAAPAIVYDPQAMNGDPQRPLGTQERMGEIRLSDDFSDFGESTSSDLNQEPEPPKSRIDKFISQQTKIFPARFFHILLYFTQAFKQSRHAQLSLLIEVLLFALTGLYIGLCYRFERYKFPMPAQLATDCPLTLSSIANSINGDAALAAAQNWCSFCNPLLDRVGEMGMYVGMALGVISTALAVATYGDTLTVFKREAGVGARASSWFIGKALFDMIKCVVFTLSFLGVFSVLVTPTGPTLNYFLTIYFFIFCMYGIGNLFSLLLNRNDAGLVAVIIGIVWMLTSGFVFQKSKLSYFADLSFPFYFGEALFSSETAALATSPYISMAIDNTTGLVTASELDLYNLVDQYANVRYGYSLSRFSLDIFVMLGLGTALRVLSLIQLKFSNPS